MHYSILINTCDNFKDCWDPFFQLFISYWPNYNGRIYLNTEYEDYSHPGLNIVAIKGCEHNNIPRNKKVTWSQCLKWALEVIDTDIVLYMQEDYFLKRPVDNELLEKEFVQISSHEDIHRIFLLSSSAKKRRSTRFPKYYIDDRNEEYYSHTQASLWKRDVLISLIEEEESGWEFEHYSTKRARLFPYNFYTVTNSSDHPIMDYVMTGIVKGRWLPECLDIFKSNGIIIDFSRRGFTTDLVVKNKKPIFKRIKNRLNIIYKKLFKNNMKMAYLYIRFYKLRNKNCEK